MRAVESFLWGVRNILAGWNTYPRTAIRINIESASNEIKCDGEVVVIVRVEKDALICVWANEWKTWEGYHKSKESAKCFERVNAILLPPRVHFNALV